MKTKNIFAGYGLRTEFVNLIYNSLMKRDYLTYADILTTYYKRPKGYYEKISYNSEAGYGELKKAFPDVLKALLAYNPNCIENNGKTGKGKAFRYVGKDDDPLAAERISRKGCKGGASRYPYQDGVPAWPFTHQAPAS